MEDKTLAIKKIIFGTFMALFMPVSAVILEGYLLVLLNLFFFFELGHLCCTISGIILITDGIRNLYGRKISSKIFLSVAVYCLFVLINSLFVDQLHAFHSFPFYLLIGRVIIPLVFIVFYLTTCKDIKFNLKTCISGMLLFLIAIPFYVLNLTLDTASYFNIQIMEPLKRLGLGYIDKQIVILLIAASLLIGNLSLIGLGCLIRKMLKKPEEANNNMANEKKALNN